MNIQYWSIVPFLRVAIMCASFQACTSMIASIPAFRIIWIHVNRLAGDGETAVAVSGSNQTAGFFEHTNYVMYLASRVQSESSAYPLSKAPTFMRIRQGTREK
jgi:hypothetical protein